jgi:hypothetical protein
MDANDLKHASEQTVEEGQGHDGSLTEGVLAGQTRSEGFWTLQVSLPRLLTEIVGVAVGWPSRRG